MVLSKSACSAGQAHINGEPEGQNAPETPAHVGWRTCAGKPDEVDDGVREPDCDLEPDGDGVSVAEVDGVAVCEALCDRVPDTDGLPVTDAVVV